ncbi:uncharacterized [Tachysurus ichikawai]
MPSQFFPLSLSIHPYVYLSYLPDEGGASDPDSTHRHASLAERTAQPSTSSRSMTSGEWRIVGTVHGRDWNAQQDGGRWRGCVVCANCRRQERDVSETYMLRAVQTSPMFTEEVRILSVSQRCAGMK